MMIDGPAIKNKKKIINYNRWLIFTLKVRRVLRSHHNNTIQGDLVFNFFFFNFIVFSNDYLHSGLVMGFLFRLSIKDRLNNFTISLDTLILSKSLVTNRYKIVKHYIGRHRKTRLRYQTHLKKQIKCPAARIKQFTVQNQESRGK